MEVELSNMQDNTHDQVYRFLATPNICSAFDPEIVRVLINIHLCVARAVRDQKGTF